ncbi:MAG: glycerol kinase GlpK [Cytophagales bacterium]|nr:glycerol kinase GlpK [Cytophagales bacterium]
MDYILALDQGTTSSRTIVFDSTGQPVASHAQEFAQIFPQSGWVEHDANEIWQSQWQSALAALRSLARTHGEAALDQVRGLGITNQRETTLLWDRASGEPIANAIVWQDHRTADRCDELRKQGKAALIQQRTGLVLDAYFSATKLAWLLDNVPTARVRAERGELCFGTIDSWLIYQLTRGKVHATDVSNASRTMLFNIHTLAWDPTLLRLFRIPDSVLPSVVPSSGVLGEVDGTLLAQAGLKRSLPIAGVAGDQQAATFGQNCFAPGTAKNTYGTGCFMLMNTGTTAVASNHQLLTTIGWQAKLDKPSRPAYCLEGSVFMGGATVQWLRDGLQIISKASDVEALAASVTGVDDCYLVPAFSGLGTPYWDGFARGTLVGMTRGTTRAHIARAALEAICLQSADVFSAMQADSGIALSELRVDGGATANNLLMQLQADVLGVPVLRPRVTETTALGAAYLAGLAVGVWSDAVELAEQWAVDRRFEPVWSDTERARKRERWQEAVERSRAWAKK